MTGGAMVKLTGALWAEETRREISVLAGEMRRTAVAKGNSGMGGERAMGPEVLGSARKLGGRGDDAPARTRIRGGLTDTLHGDRARSLEMGGAAANTKGGAARAVVAGIPTPAHMVGLVYTGSAESTPPSLRLPCRVLD